MIKRARSAIEQSFEFDITPAVSVSRRARRPRAAPSSTTAFNSPSALSPPCSAQTRSSTSPAPPAAPVAPSPPRPSAAASFISASDFTAKTLKRPRVRQRVHHELVEHVREQPIDEAHRVLARRRASSSVRARESRVGARRRMTSKVRRVGSIAHSRARTTRTEATRDARDAR